VKGQNGAEGGCQGGSGGAVRAKWGRGFIWRDTGALARATVRAAAKRRPPERDGVRQTVRSHQGFQEGY
jgi:hypothetical protein